VNDDTRVLYRAAAVGVVVVLVSIAVASFLLNGNTVAESGMWSYLCGGPGCDSSLQMDLMLGVLVGGPMGFLVGLVAGYAYVRYAKKRRQPFSH